MKTALALVCFLGGTAAAQPPSTSTAKQYVEAGVAAQKNGDYTTAIDLYAKANAIAPHPVLLYNIAQAHRLAAAAARTKRDAAAVANHRDAAREYYRKYLDTNPTDELEVTARGWLAKLDQQWAEDNPKEEAARRAEESAKREAVIKAEEERLAKIRREAAERETAERKKISAAVRDTTVANDRAKARTIQIVGLAVTGGGLLATGAGVYFGLEARRLSRGLTDENVFDTQRIARGNAADRNFTIATITGASLVIGGAVTFYVGRRIKHRHVESVVAIPTDGGAAVLVGGGF